MVLRLPDSWSNWNLEKLVFGERGKAEYPEKNLSEQRREQSTDSTQLRRQRWDLNPGHIGGRRALSPLRHPLLPYANKVTWLGTDKQFKSKNCNSLCFQPFRFVTIRWIKMVKGNELCLAFVRYVIGFENIRHFVLVPRPPMKNNSFSGLLF